MNTIQQVYYVRSIADAIQNGSKFYGISTTLGKVTLALPEPYADYSLALQSAENLLEAWNWNRFKPTIELV